jgi:hypothetical protein
LEDFGEGPIQYQGAEEGSELLKRFLDTWKDRASGTQEEQVEMLRTVAAEFKESFDGNAWIQSLLHI